MFIPFHKFLKYFSSETITNFFYIWLKKGEETQLGFKQTINGFFQSHPLHRTLTGPTQLLGCPQEASMKHFSFIWLLESEQVP